MGRGRRYPRLRRVLQAMRFSDEMVEAGAKAAFWQDDLGGHVKGPWTWETIPEEGRMNYRAMMTAALEAIAAIKEG